MPFYGPFPLSDAPSETPQFLDRSQIDMFRQLFSRIFPGSSNFATFAGPGGGTVGLGFSHGSQLFSGQPPSSLNAIQNSAPPLAQGISGLQPETITGALAGLGLPSSQLTSLEQQNQPGATTFLGQPGPGPQPSPVSLLSPTGLPIKPVAEIGSDLANTVFGGGGGGGTSGIGSPLSNDIGSGPISSLGFNTQGGGVQGALFGLSSSDVAAQLGFQAPTAIGGTAATIPAELAGFGGEFGGAVGAPATVPVSGTTGLLGSGGALAPSLGVGALTGVGTGLAHLAGFPTGPAEAIGGFAGAAAAGGLSAGLGAAAAAFAPAIPVVAAIAGLLEEGGPLGPDHSRERRIRNAAGALPGHLQDFTDALGAASNEAELQGAFQLLSNQTGGGITFSDADPEGLVLGSTFADIGFDAPSYARDQLRPFLEERRMLIRLAESGNPEARALLTQAVQGAKDTRTTRFLTNVVLPNIPRDLNDAGLTAGFGSNTAALGGLADLMAANPSGVRAELLRSGRADLLALLENRPRVPATPTAQLPVSFAQNLEAARQTGAMNPLALVLAQNPPTGVVPQNLLVYSTAGTEPGQLSVDLYGRPIHSVDLGEQGSIWVYGPGTQGGE